MDIRGQRQLAGALTTSAAGARGSRTPEPVTIPQRDETSYRVHSIAAATATIAEVWLSPLEAPMDYRPGEYVLLEDADRRLPQRSYSIANAPRADGRLSLLVTRTSGPTSSWVHDQLRAGEEVTVTGPYGSFVADPSSHAPCLYLAAGSGVAPIRALIEEALRVAPERPRALLISAGVEAAVPGARLFETWEAEHPSFCFIRTLTRDRAGYPFGRVPEILSELFPRLGGFQVFVAGAGGFVRDCVGAAEALGARDLHAEPFFLAPPC